MHICLEEGQEILVVQQTINILLNHCNFTHYELRLSKNVEKNTSSLEMSAEAFHSPWLGILTGLPDNASASSYLLECQKKY